MAGSREGTTTPASGSLARISRKNGRSDATTPRARPSAISSAALPVILRYGNSTGITGPGDVGHLAVRQRPVDESQAGVGLGGFAKNADIESTVRLPADHHLDSTGQVFGRRAGEIQSLVLPQATQTGHHRQSRIQRKVSDHVRSRPGRGIRGAECADGHEDHAATRAEDALDDFNGGAAVTHDDVGLPGHETVAVPVPSVATLVRLHVVHGPDALDAESARGPEELAQEEQPLRRLCGSRQPARAGESFSPDVFRPVQMDGVHLGGPSLQPSNVDVEIVGCRDAAGLEGGMT